MSASHKAEPYVWLGLPSPGEIMAHDHEAERTLWSQIEAQHPFFAECRTKAHRAISSNNIAKQSYDKLLADGLRSSEMLELLVGLAALPVPKRKWSAWNGSGKTEESLEYFPTRLRGVADEIEQLNKHPLVNPEVFVHAYAVPESMRKQVSASFGRLPAVLRQYANFVEAQHRVVSGHLKQIATGKSGNRRALLRLVTSQTGRGHYEDVANLLNAAGDLDVTGDVLKMLASRSRKQRPSL